MLASTPSPAASAIPADRQIKAAVVATLTAPADVPMHMPTDVAVDSRGNAFVADGANDRVACFDADGRFSRALTRLGDQTLGRPVGLSVDADDRLWIADTGNHRVIVASPPDKLVKAIELPPTPEHAFDATDVVVTRDAKRSYIVDNDNHRLAIRDNNSGQIQFVGGFGEALGKFRWPFMIALDGDGYAYVTEAIGARAQRLSGEDRWAGQIGRWGVELGQFYRPKGIAVSPRGQVFISDSSLHVIQVFSPRGETLGVLTDGEGQLLRFQHPMGMAFDHKGRLYVVELTADRVAVVTLPPEWTGSMPTTRPEGPP